MTIKEGDTFYLVSDSLPEQYGGEGTDILLNMEQAQFGFDWDGTINFQVKHKWIHMVEWLATVELRVWLIQKVPYLMM